MFDQSVLSFTLVIALLTFNVAAQAGTPQTGITDNLLRQLEQLHGKRNSTSSVRLSDEIGTCGFRLRCEIDRHWNEFTASQRQQIQSILDPPPMQANRIMGHFRIFYDTSASSSDVPALIYIDSDNVAQRIPGTAEAFVDSVGTYFNYVWSYQVDTLGYIPPPLD